MKQNRRNLINATLAASLVISAGAANAKDHRIWREQVPLSSGPAIEYEAVSVESSRKRGSDSLPWREQVKIFGGNRVYIGELALNRHGNSNDHLMWREQLRPNSAEPVLTATRDARQSNNAQK